MSEFLGPETDIMGERYFMVYTNVGEVDRCQVNLGLVGKAKCRWLSLGGAGLDYMLFGEVW